MNSNVSGKMLFFVIMCEIVIVGLIDSTNGVEIGNIADKEPAVIDLSGTWEFGYTPGLSDTLPGKDRYKVSMPIPGCWDDTVNQEQSQKLWPDAQFNPGYKPVTIPNIDSSPKKDRSPDGSLPYLLGVGWYRRTVDVPKEWQGRQVVLNVGYVVNEARVFVNGRMVCHHTGHCTNWRVNLSKELNYGGQNEVVIAVDNIENQRGGCRLRGWKGNSAGIFDRVWLKASGEACLNDVYVYLKDGQLSWQAGIDGEIATDARLDWRVIDPKTKTAILSGSTKAATANPQWSSEAKGLETWSDRSPRLYQLEVKLVMSGRDADVIQQPFGLRRTTTEGMRLKLNGQPIFLRGMCEHAYFPQTCTPPTDIEWYHRSITRYKEIGFNWLRCHTWVPSEQYMQAADELGIMIQIEAPSETMTIEEWRDILMACRRHPSVIMYCGGNEQMLDEPKIEWLAQLAAEQKKLVPDGLFSPMEGERGITREAESGRRDQDNEGFGVRRVEDPTPYNPARLARLQEFCDIFSPYAWGDLSYSTLRGERRWIDIRTALYQKPVFSHELGIIGGYLNFELEKRYEGTRIGPCLYRAAREHLQQSGLFDRAGRYYHNASSLQFELTKDVIEMARQCQTLSGYDFLGGIDTHWHRTGYCCGILNEFGEFKIGETAADILPFNGESILMISEQRERTVLAKNPFVRTVMVSWYGERPLEKGLLSWELVSTDGKVLKQGQCASSRVESGQIAELGDIGFISPTLSEPIKVTLRVTLAAGDQNLTNRWDYWIFPYYSKVGASDKIVVVDRLNQEILDKLTAGARVVLLGYKPFPAQAIRFQQGTAGRPQLNFASVIEKHPLMDRFPHDGWCSWPFYPMMKRSGEASAVMFNDLDVPFDPIIEMVSSYKNVQKQAALFEVSVGKGKLLVCTLNLATDDPAAKYLRRILYDYAAGDQFNPRTVMPVETIEKLLKAGATDAQEEKATDQGLDPRVQPSKKTPLAK